MFMPRFAILSHATPQSESPIQSTISHWARPLHDRLQWPVLRGRRLDCPVARRRYVAFTMEVGDLHCLL